MMTSMTGRRVLVTAMAIALAVSAGACDAAPKGRTGTATPSRQTASTSPGPGTLPTGVLQSLTDVDFGPLYLVDAFGSVWVTSHRGHALDRIDPVAGKVTAHIDVGQNSCSPVYPTPTLLLISPCDDGTNSMLIDPRTNQVVGSIPGWVYDFAFGSAWFSDAAGTTLLRVDLSNHDRKTVAHIWVGCVAHGGGRLWVAEGSGDDGTWHGGIAEVNPVTNRVVRTIPVKDPGTYANLVYAFGALWLQGGGQPFFDRIDPVTGHVTTFPIPAYQPNADAQGGDIAAGTGSIWMQTAPMVIGRFDPRTGALIDRYPADPIAGGSWPLPAYGSLWVSNFDTNQVWRDRVTT
jgi:streptogramin lyase